MTILTEFIQPPARGICVISCGRSASKKNGRANTKENPTMPTSGHLQFPWEANTRSVPTNGAVHVNDVRENVRPMSMMPTTLPSCFPVALRFKRFMSPIGTCRKKTPNRLRAKLRKTVVMMRLTQGFEANLLIPEAPKTIASDIPSATK